VKRIFSILSGALAAVLCAAGCTVGPKYQRATAPTAAHWDVQDPWRESAPKDALAKGQWWTVRTNTLLYTVVVRPMKNERGRNTAGEHALETITDTTGGAVFYPDSAAELDSIFDRINRELRTQYRLGYYPNPRGPADTYRRIEVTVTPPASNETKEASTANAATKTVDSAQTSAYSVRHRKSYYTGLP
jgi:hypothetical protein